MDFDARATPSATCGEIVALRAVAKTGSTGRYCCELEGKSDVSSAAAREKAAFRPLKLPLETTFHSQLKSDPLLETHNKEYLPAMTVTGQQLEVKEHRRCENRCKDAQLTN